MSLHPDPRLSLLLIVTVSAYLPSPQHVEMIAVDMNYTLQWDCNSTHLGRRVNFTVEYMYNNEEEEWYKRACDGSSECQCDLTPFNLPFSGSFVIRVRAEAENQLSNWTLKSFIPDLEVQLSSPRVNVKADDDVLTLTISESVMRNLINLKYRVQYWEKLKPEQKHTKDYDSPHAPLSSLKSQTEYCVQVSTFNPEYEKSSDYSSPQCVYTTGKTPSVWPMVLLKLFVAMCTSAALAALIYGYYRCRRNSPVFTAPESILAFTSVPLLPEAQEECYTIADVITPAVPLTHTPKEEPEQEDTPELQPQWSDGPVQDSGFSSGLES